MIKRSVLQEDWANAYAPNSKASNIWGKNNHKEKEIHYSDQRTDIFEQCHQWLDLIDSDTSTYQQQNIHVLKAYMEHSPRSTTFWAIKHILNLKEQKSF